MLLWIVAALSIGLVAAFTARAKGRPFKPWLAYGTLLGVVALPHALLLRDDEERDGADEREAGVLFDFNPLASRRADRFPDRDEPPGWDPGELPPEGLVMRAPQPEAEADIAPVWSEDDFARIAGEGRKRGGATTADERRESRRSPFEPEEKKSPVSESEPTAEAPVPGESNPEREDFRRPVPDQGASPGTAENAEPVYESSDRVAASSVEPETARAGQEPPPAEVESGHAAEALSDSEPPPPPPEVPDPDLDIPVPPPVFERSRRSGKAFSRPQRVQRSRPWDAGASVPEDYRQEPRFDLGGDDVDDFDDREAAQMARRFAPHGADDARQAAYGDHPDRGPGFRHLVAVACIALVTFLAWWQFGWLWAPPGTDATQSAATQEGPAGPVPEHVASVPVVPPESPGADSRATASTHGNEQGSDGQGAAADATRKSANTRLPSPGDHVPLPPSMPEARARLGMTAVSPPEKATPPVPSRGQESGRAAADKGEISAAGSLVARIQAELRKRGYGVGSIDGRAGPRTRQAIVAFKRDNGLSTTSAIDDKLIERLGIAGRRLYPFQPPEQSAGR